jgi:hypothetical protein
MSSGHRRYETTNLIRVVAVARGWIGGVLAPASRLDSDLSRSSADELIMPWCLFDPADYMYHSEPPQNIRVARKDMS